MCACAKQKNLEEQDKQ